MLLSENVVLLCQPPPPLYSFIHSATWITNVFAYYRVCTNYGIRLYLFW